MNGKIFIVTLILFCLVFSGCVKKQEEKPEVVDKEMILEAHEELEKAEEIAPVKPDETNDWKTYENEKHNYSIKYPKEWFFLKDACCPPPPTFVSFNNITEEKLEYSRRQMEEDVWGLDVLCGYEGVIDEIGEVQLQRDEGVENVEMKVNGSDAIKFKKRVYPDSDKEYVFSYYIANGTDEGCRVVFSDKCEVCEKIASTFKFSE